MRRATTRFLGLLLVLAGVALVPAPAFAAAPTVTGLSPAYGPPGTDVTITGTGFTPATTVRFTGKTATGVVVDSPTSLTVPVPVGAKTGKVTVTTVEGSAQSAASFTVTTIGLAPTVGPPTTRTTVTLAGFRPSEAVDVYVGTTQVALVVASATGTGTTRVTVPADAQPGELPVSAVGRRTGYAVQALFTVRSDWPQTGFDAAGSGHNPYETTLTAATVSRSKRVFRSSPKRAVQNTAAVVDGIVYAKFTNGEVRAFDAVTGALRWSVYVGGQGQAAPAVVGGRLYVDSGSTLRTFDARTGAPGWTFPGTSSFLSAPRVVGDTVYIGDFAGVLFAIDAATGVERWRFTADTGISVSPVVDDEGLVYLVAGSDLYVVAPGSPTGTLVWRRTPLAGNTIAESPVTDGDTVYVPVATRFLAYAVDNPTNQYVITTPGGTVSSLALADQVLYVHAGTRLTAYASGDGSVNWFNELGVGASGGIVTVAGGVVYAGGTGKTAAVRQSDGVRLRNWPFGGFNAGVAVSDGVAYVPDTDTGWIKGYAATP